MSTPLQLKPMSAGDILDRAIRIYRQNFIPLVTIVAIVTIPVLLVQVLTVIVLSPLATNPTFTPDALLISQLGAVGLNGIVTLVAAILGVFQLGALTFFISERFLERSVTVREAYGKAFGKWLALLLATILLALVGVALGAVLVGAFAIPFISVAALGSDNDAASALGAVGILCLCVLLVPAGLAFVYLFTRWAFWVQAIMLENYNSTGGLGRSWKLVKGSFWRVLAFFILLAVLIYALVFGLTGAILLVTLFVPSETTQLILQAVASAIVGILVGPLQYAVLTVLYYDLRIRKEGFDLQMKMQGGADAPLDLPSLTSGTTG